MPSDACLIEIVPLEAVRCIEALTIRYAPARHTIRAAIAAGNLPIVQWLFEGDGNAHERAAAFDHAATFSQIEIAAWLLGKSPPRRAMNLAARAGHLHFMQWLHALPGAENGMTVGCTTAAMDGAAATGHMNIILWLHVNRHEGCTAAAMEDAAARGDIDVVRWLHDNRWEFSADNPAAIFTVSAMDLAAAQGHLHMVEWLHANRPEGPSSRAINYAARGGHLHVVRFLMENYSHCTRHAQRFAKNNGHGHVVAYLAVYGCAALGLMTATCAATHGHLEVIWGILGRKR